MSSILNPMILQVPYIDKMVLNRLEWFQGYLEKYIGSEEIQLECFGTFILF